MFRLQRETAGPVTDRHPRRGFTLIELLMVIVIIGILMSFAFAGVTAVMRRAKVAEVKVEIDGLSSALSQFKSKYGFYPPSSIKLYATANGWKSDPRSRAVIRRMFPQFDFNGTPTSRPGGAPWTTTKTLTGPECLVFFLGGVQKGGIPSGFSSNPARPFSLAGSKRIDPLFNFDVSRVKAADLDKDNMHGYISPMSAQTRPYLYLSAYNGRGYRCQDILSVGLEAAYHQGLHEDRNCDRKLDPGEDVNDNKELDLAPAWNPKSFQLICPGFDNEYGVGGAFDPNDDGASFDRAERLPEADNITNFHTGMLAP